MKYSFDLTPEMGRTPINFVCQKCGVDSSQMVNQLIRQELGLASSPAPLGRFVPAVAPPGHAEPHAAAAIVVPLAQPQLCAGTGLALIPLMLLEPVTAFWIAVLSHPLAIAYCAPAWAAFLTSIFS